MTPDKRTLLTVMCSTLLLAACDVLLDDQGKIEARREAEGRAVGSACRHVGRALEECYERSPRISKAAIFAGWRDMDSYMRENNIQIVSPDMPMEAPGKQGERSDEKTKAAEALPADPKSGAAETSPAQAAGGPPGKKAAQTQAPIKPSSAPGNPGRFREFEPQNRFAM